jgi:hypothetical protein
VIISWSWARPTYGEYCAATLATTMRSGRTARWRRTRRSLVRFSALELLGQTRSLAGFTTITFGRRFSAHTRAASNYPLAADCIVAVLKLTCG